MSFSLVEQARRGRALATALLLISVGIIGGILCTLTIPLLYKLLLGILIVSAVGAAHAMGIMAHTSRLQALSDRFDSEMKRFKSSER